MDSVMTEENVATQEFAPTDPEVAAEQEEASKIETARQQIAEEEAAQSGLILGKYESTDDLAAAYQNLQREYTRLKDGSVDQGEPTPEPVAESEPEGGEPAEQPEAEADTGNALNPEQLATITNSLYEQAGGQQQYASLTAWAKDNCSSDQINAFNEALGTGDQYIILNALKGIQYDYMMGNGFEPKLTGGRAPTQEVQGFRSRYEYQTAMNDPRYDSDPAFRKDVERKVAVSPDNLFGVN